MINKLSDNVSISTDSGAILFKGGDGIVRVVGHLKNDVYTIQLNRIKNSIEVSTIGFKYEIIETGGFENIEVWFNGLMLTTTRERVLSKGELKKSGNTGDEIHLFLPIAQFSKH